MLLMLLDLEELVLEDGSLFKETHLGEQVIKELKRLQEIDQKPLMPHNRNITRKEDMSRTGELRLFRQEDGDICVAVCNERGESAGIEFCVPGTGGGRSPNTLKALNDLGIAMIKDNEQKKF